MIAQAKSISAHLFALANSATSTLHALPKHKCWMANRHGWVHTSDILGGPSHLSALLEAVHLTKPKRRKPTKTYGIDSTRPMLVRYTTLLCALPTSPVISGRLIEPGIISSNCSSRKVKREDCRLSGRDVGVEMQKLRDVKVEIIRGGLHYGP
jgi:hypothetical protein